MPSKSDETVLLTIDVANDLRWIDMVMDAFFTVGAVAILAKHPIRKEAFTPFLLVVSWKMNVFSVPLNLVPTVKEKPWMALLECSITYRR